MNQILPKKVILVQHRKLGHHHWIHHIQISLDTKFHLKQRIYVFWSNLLKKGRKNLVSCIPKFFSDHEIYLEKRIVEADLPSSFSISLLP